jgi:predicted enzyme related to lactoylglutathione lyase
MAIENVQLATVFVTDQERALEFYVDKLGLEKRIDGMEEEGGRRFVVVAPADSHLGLAISEGSDNDGTAAKVGGFSGIVLGTSDVEATHRELAERGVRFVEEPVRQPWGSMQALILDPDENVLALHEN